MYRVVYFIRSGQSACYKVGLTNSVDTRLSALQSGNPEKLTVSFIIRPTGRKADAQAIETGLHRILDEYKIHGEWFKFAICLSCGVIQSWLDKIGFLVIKMSDTTIYTERASEPSELDKFKAGITTFLELNQPARIVDIHKATGYRMGEIKNAIYDMSEQNLIKRRIIDRLNHYYLSDYQEAPSLTPQEGCLSAGCLRKVRLGRGNLLS